MKTRLLLTLIGSLFTLVSFSQTNHIFDTWYVPDSLGNWTYITIDEGDIITINNNLGGTETWQIVADGNASSTGTVMNGQTIWTDVIDNSYSPNFTITVNGDVYTLHGVMLDVTVIPSSVGFEEKEKKTFAIYPNPTTDFLNISGDYVESVKIYDLNGRLVLSDSKTKVNVSGLDNGVYTVVVNESENLKLIKN